MGDPRRFSLFADVIAANFPSNLPVADVAGGKGYLQVALRQRGMTAQEERTVRAVLDAIKAEIGE